MASVKIRFRRSKVDGGEGIIYHQVIHNRITCLQKTSYYIYCYKWNKKFSEVILPKFNKDRKRCPLDISDKIRIESKLKKLNKVRT